MELQELSIEELNNIEGGSTGYLLYDLFFGAIRTLHLASELSDSLKDNPNYGNAIVYK